MSTIFAFLRTTSFLLMLSGTLAVSTATLAMRTASLSAQVTTMTVSVAATALAHRKAIVATIIRTKAKARLRRVMVAVPLVGIAAAGAFERQDYLAWQEDHPNGDLTAYGCEVASVSAEVIDDVLQELPEQARPSRYMVLSLLPDCEEES